jgi:methyl-accepting chemotaxis protein
MTDMVATAVHEMGLTVQEIAQNAGNAAVLRKTLAMRRCRHGSGGGLSGISKACPMNRRCRAVGELANQVASIDQVLAVIAISEQTNPGAERCHRSGAGR